MSDQDVLFDIQRTLGRFEQHLVAQDQMLAELKADVQELRSKPTRRWKALGKWAATVAATVVAALLVFRLKLKG